MVCTNGLLCVRAIRSLAPVRCLCSSGSLPGWWGCWVLGPGKAGQGVQEDNSSSCKKVGVETTGSC